MSKYEVLQGYYAVHDELGSGGKHRVQRTMYKYHIL